MHYIRLLRPPSLDARGRLKLVLTITTDLSDSFLCPDEPVPVSVYLYDPWHDLGQVRTCLTPRSGGESKTFWTAGSRVLKLELPVPKQTLLKIENMLNRNEKPLPKLRIVASHDLQDPPKAAEIPFDRQGRILALSAPFPEKGREPSYKATRQFQVSPGIIVDVAEELGESMDRHVWDAGIVTIGVITNMLGSSVDKSLPEVWDKTPLLKELLCSAAPESPLNFIELGCGVGILGVGLAAALYRRLHSELTAEPASDESPSCILLTDMPDAEELARENLTEQENKTANGLHKPVRLIGFESLDWEDGKNGVFGSKARAASWDVIIISDCTYNVDTLSALVQTMSEIHKLSMNLDQTSTKVMLATKPRHSSEKAFFDLMERDGWVIVESASQLLPVIGMEEETVEIYLFGKDP